MIKKFKKEIIAVASGMVVAYGWQLFALLMGYISEPNEDFITAYMFMPEITIQIAIMPMTAWLLMGLLKVTWFNKWLCITACGLAFLIPFALISALTVFVVPALWYKAIYWVVNIAISVLLAFILFRPFLKFKCSDVEQ